MANQNVPQKSTKNKLLNLKKNPFTRKGNNQL